MAESSSTSIPYRDVVLRSPSEVVYLEYDPATLPPKPTDGSWTRFVCISDTHTRHFEVPNGDVLLHSGDLTNIGTLKEFTTTIEWLSELPHKQKIIIAGNHDLTLHRDWYELEWERWHKRKAVGKQDYDEIIKLLKGKDAVEAGIVYLEDEEYKFRLENGREWSVYGSPWSPEFFNWAFGYNRGVEADKLISKFPKTDILLTHGPPHKIFDRTLKLSDAGCETLRAHLPRLRPRLHLAGHIHESHGAYIHAWDPVKRNRPPSVQHPAMRLEDEDDDGEEQLGSIDCRQDDLDDLDVKPDFGSEPVTPQGNSADPEEDANNAGQDRELELEVTAQLDHTVFVNASAWPSGPAAAKVAGKIPFGGPGFQAVVVDLKD